jgi:hypothetical protein
MASLTNALKSAAKCFEPVVFTAVAILVTAFLTEAIHRMTPVDFNWFQCFVSHHKLASSFTIVLLFAIVTFFIWKKPIEQIIKEQ